MRGHVHIGWLLCVFTLSGCATRAPQAPVTTPDAQVMVRLADADRLASRGCYLCLREAAAAYDALLKETASPLIARHALENDLMIALREIDLRMPDSGAREEAERLQAQVTTSYAPYFEFLDVLGPAETRRSVASPAVRAQLKTLAEAFEAEWPASPMKAYFYISAALSAAMVNELKPQLEAILTTHGADLSLKYRMQAFLPTFSEEASRTLIGQETGFGEVHFLLGQRAVLDARLEDAHRELTRARQLLPDSAAITLVLANVKMGYARYAEALELYESVTGDPDAAMGRARALSYLRRHAEAMAALDDLLKDLRNNPGEKYYWRGWNRLRLGETQSAYEDAVAALKAMRNNEVYRLAGIASFGLDRLGEARGYFEDALNLNPGDCDAERYLGQIDATERQWRPAADRFSTARTCYEDAIARESGELARHEQDISGLSNGLITALRAEIDELRSLRAIAAANAQATLKNAGMEQR